MPHTTVTTSRRTFLRSSGIAAGGALLLRYTPAGLLWETVYAQGQAAQVPASQSVLDQSRAKMAAAPIQTTKLSDRLLMLSGPGGNVLVLHGADGKVVVDTFVQPAWTGLKSALDGIDKSPVTAVIDTHWHFDHADNNASFRKLGAKVVAHANTTKRLTQKHSVLGMEIPPSPPDALPTDTFNDKHSLSANGEQVVLSYVQPAHTDTDILVQCTKGNVVHMGDLFFNGMYPFIDASTAGNINGMIAAADRTLKMVDASTKIVPGHGPLADRASLERYRTMMATVRDRVRERKKKGETLQQVQAAKPTAEFDAGWGKGFLPADAFVGLVYNTL